MVALFKRMHDNYPDTAEVFFGSKWGGVVSSWDGTVKAGFDPRGRAWYLQAQAAKGDSIIKALIIISLNIIILLIHLLFSFHLLFP